MKINKSMNSIQLQAAVVEFLLPKFKPSISDMQQGIDLLIQKDYIHRSPDDPSVYTYIA
jgi:Cullin protein neddylation domain